MRASLAIVVRVLIVVMALGCVVIQVLMLPLFGSQTVESAPEVAYLFWPVLVATEAFMLAAHVVLWSMWLLVGRVARDEVFCPTSFRYVDAIIWALLAASLLAGGTLVGVVGIADVGGPPVGVLGVAASVGSLAAAVLVALMRGLLVQSTEMRDFLEAVV